MKEEGEWESHYLISMYMYVGGIALLYRNEHVYNIQYIYTCIYMYKDMYMYRYVWYTNATQLPFADVCNSAWITVKQYTAAILAKFHQSIKFCARLLFLH